MSRRSLLLLPAGAALCLTVYWLAAGTTEHAPAPEAASVQSLAIGVTADEEPAATPCPDGCSEGLGLPPAEVSPHEASQPEATPHVPLDGPTPVTEQTWLVPLELGWDGVDVGTPMRREFPFRPAVAHATDELFQARVRDASGGSCTVLVPVGGLIPLDLLTGDDGPREQLAVGDQLFLVRAPVLLRLPDMVLPAQVELVRPDGHVAASFEVSLLDGEPVASVRQ